MASNAVDLVAKGELVGGLRSRVTCLSASTARIGSSYKFGIRGAARRLGRISARAAG